MPNSAVETCSTEEEIQFAYDRTVHRQLAMQDALRRLGFEPTEILMSWNRGPRTVVKTNEKEFAISYPGASVDSHADDEIEHFAEWLKESNRWYNELTDTDRSIICDRHAPEPVVQLVVVALKAKGFRLRNIEH